MLEMVGMQPKWKQFLANRLFHGDNEHLRNVFRRDYERRRDYNSFLVKWKCLLGASRG